MIFFWHIWTIKALPGRGGRSGLSRQIILNLLSESISTSGSDQTENPQIHIFVYFPVVEFHQGLSASNRSTPSSFYFTLHQSSTLKLNLCFIEWLLRRPQRAVYISVHTCYYKMHGRNGVWHHSTSSATYMEMCREWVACQPVSQGLWNWFCVLFVLESIT